MATRGRGIAERVGEYTDPLSIQDRARLAVARLTAADGDVRVLTDSEASALAAVLVSRLGEYETDGRDFEVDAEQPRFWRMALRWLVVGIVVLVVLTCRLVLMLLDLVRFVAHLAWSNRHRLDADAYLFMVAACVAVGVGTAVALWTS